MYANVSTGSQPIYMCILSGATFSNSNLQVHNCTFICNCPCKVRFNQSIGRGLAALKINVVRNIPLRFYVKVLVSVRQLVHRNPIQRFCPQIGPNPKAKKNKQWVQSLKKVGYRLLTKMGVDQNNTVNAFIMT